ncbi:MULTISPECIES: aspartate kinase [Bradyrhizobium]|jgi:aspartate kinase|uniref:aspartate kinase n=1 Tax=Bradyrhizobium TaxID=374 RepID=UPI0004ACC744|nr:MULTISPECIES: aspartate kinase [Bradyrhizobium]MBR0947045.1 aspartate kinase [Bradyrhizobium liaoningense]MBR1033766.1 aspartate kinase [Bradyrhizobium liaoningense]MBR1070803.1 aspartate kinase [Bradyrhizobium liaoningense]MDI2077700.1 aspartate kinase [Bradyrhizobium sp. Mp27]
MPNNPTIVQKYGGVCLETPEKIRAVAKSLADLHNRGHRVVAIVSAMGKTTDELIKAAYQVSPHPNRRELDMLLTTGERISMSLMSMALSDLGAPAISFTGSQAGVMTDESHSSARILDVRPARVLEELGRGRIVVLAGFQGVNPRTKEITTLGRGGSDTTAVAMAAALKAERCEIIKEVDGICSADPRIVANAKPLRRLDFASLSEMCFWGAKVLHFRSVELAQSQNIPLFLRKWGNSEHSTRVMKEVIGMESGKVLAVNSMARIEHVEIASTNLSHGLEKFAQHLKQNGLSWPQVLTSAFTAGKTRVMMTCESESLDTLLRTLERSKDLRKERETLSSVSLTCFGGVSSDLPFQAIQILQSHGVVVDKYVLSPHSINFFVPVETREAAVTALHSLI